MGTEEAYAGKGRGGRGGRARWVGWDGKGEDERVDGRVSGVRVKKYEGVKRCERLCSTRRTDDGGLLTKSMMNHDLRYVVAMTRKSKVSSIAAVPS